VQTKKRSWVGIYIWVVIVSVLGGAWYCFDDLVIQDPVERKKWPLFKAVILTSDGYDPNSRIWQKYYHNMGMEPPPKRVSAIKELLHRIEFAR
jgi:hypothetical protein